MWHDTYLEPPAEPRFACTRCNAGRRQRFTDRRGDPFASDRHDAGADPELAPRGGRVFLPASNRHLPQSDDSAWLYQFSQRIVRNGPGCDPHIKGLRTRF
jgi:hypothetical protein